MREGVPQSGGSNLKGLHKRADRGAGCPLENHLDFEGQNQHLELNLETSHKLVLLKYALKLCAHAGEFQ